MQSKFYQKQSLGAALRQARKASGKAQSDLAAQINVSVPTIRALENDTGQLGNYRSALDALGLSLSGWWNTAEHGHIGETVAALREGRGVTQRGLARAIGVSHPTIFKLEHTGDCRLDILQAVFRELNHSLWLDDSEQPSAHKIVADNADASADADADAARPTLRYLSLFSGIGGFECGIEQVMRSRGGTARCVGFAEINPAAISIYRQHFPHTNLGDATEISAEALPTFDLLVAGFPCQAFSIAGQRSGFDDTRGTKFFEIARIARAKQPRLLLLENVAGLLSHEEGRTFGVILGVLDELGYDAQWQVLNSKDFGVPQNRERVFIVGHHRGTPRPEVFPFIGGDQEDGSARVLAHTLNASDWRGGNRNQRQTVIEHGDDAPTLIREGDGEGARVRRLTPTECERLQGFPDGWTAGVSDRHRYECLGNAVTVPVVRAIVERFVA